MTTIHKGHRTIISLALYSLLALSACEGDKPNTAPEQATSATASTVSIPMDHDPTVSAAVKATIADMKAADPNVNLVVSEDGLTLTGDQAAIGQLASSLTSKYGDGNVAMGKKSYCIVQYGPLCGDRAQPCHRGSYWNLLFAQMDRYRFTDACGTSKVVAGSCPDTCTVYN